MCVIMGNVIKGLHCVSIIQLVWIISTPYLASIFCPENVVCLLYLLHIPGIQLMLLLIMEAESCLIWVHIVCNIGF